MSDEIRTKRTSTTSGYLRHWAAERPDHPALRWAEGQLTYSELDEHSSQLAQALRATGVGRGDRVAFLDRNSPEQVELFFAAAKLSAVPCPVNYRLSPREIAYIVTDSQAKIFAVGEEFLPAVERIASQLRGVHIVVIGSAHGAWHGLEEWRDTYEAVDPNEPLEPSDVAYQLYSSGTTGHPKGVLITQANLSAGMDLYPEIMGFGPDSVSIVPMPLYHIGGGGWALEGFAQGATNILVREIVPDKLVNTIVEERVTHGFLVPAVLQLMLAVPGIERRDFSALQSLLYGASPISEKVLAASIRTFGCQFVQAYGLTESTGTIIYLPAADHEPDGPMRHRLRAIGVPTRRSEAKVVDLTTGATLSSGQVGEIWVKGPTVMVGYWHLPEQTAETIKQGGWLRTGDAGYQDDDGYFYLHDRVKDMIVSGAENIYPAEVENVMMSHPEVADVAVIGVPHEQWGETPLAMVVRTADSEMTEEDLLAFCRENLARFKCPTRLQWISELPRNPSGKVLKKDLRAPFWEGRDRMVG
jgi:long-chain acyl-CoA synthetase